MSGEPGFQLCELGAMLKRRGKVSAAVAGTVFLSAFWLAMALPNEYQSYATILVEPQAVDPELVAAGVRESDLNERLQLMAAQILSRPRLSRIIDELELYPEESEYLLREEVIGLMRDHVRVEPVIPELQGPVGRVADQDINTFRIFFLHGDSQTAMEVAQRLANDFIEEHINERVNISQKSLEFIQAKLERLTGLIREVEANVAAIKAANAGRLPEQAEANHRRLERLTQELGFAQRFLATARSDEAFFRSQLASATAVGNVFDEASPQRRIQMLELLLSEFQARGYTEKHPDVIKTEAELQSIRQRVDATRTEPKPDGPKSFTQRQAEAELRRAELRVKTSAQEVARLVAEMDEIRTLLAETPAVAKELDVLEREYQHLFMSYQDFSNRRLEASVQADMERRQLGEQFRVLEAAFEAPAPASPNRIFIVVLGAVFALAIGGGAGILLENADSSLHSVRQLQAALNAPVLASIPRIWLESDRIALRRSRIRQALATAGVVAFALVGSLASNVWVNGVPGWVPVWLGGEQQEDRIVVSAPVTPGGDS